MLGLESRVRVVRLDYLGWELLLLLPSLNIPRLLGPRCFLKVFYRAQKFWKMPGHDSEDKRSSSQASGPWLFQVIDLRLKAS